MCDGERSTFEVSIFVLIPHEIVGAGFVKENNSTNEVRVE